MKRHIIPILFLCTLILCACSDTKPQDQAEVTANSDISKPDIDLTKLSSTMVYSEVYNIMQDPANYKGKTIKIRGIYLPVTGTDNAAYPACLIQDATACCQQGIEFVTKDNNYPKEGTSMVVQGKFEAYVDKSDGQTYYHLKDAVLL